MATLTNLFRGFRAPSNQVDTSRVSSQGMTYCKNIVWLPNGTLAPRTEDNLKKLHRYVKRHFKNSNYNDKRTRAYRWMKQHDSEFGETPEA